MEILDVFFKHKLRFLFVCRCWAGQCGWNGLRNVFFFRFYISLFLLLVSLFVLVFSLPFAIIVLLGAAKQSCTVFYVVRNVVSHNGIVLSFLSLTVLYIPIE